MKKETFLGKKNMAECKMQKEHETQVLDVDVENIKRKLRELGAEEFDEVLQKRKIFDIKCLEDEGIGEWVRLRQVNDKTTLTYKHRKSTEIDGTEEIEVEVEDFDKTAALLSKLSCWTAYYYQENKRIKFVLDDIEFTLDAWPKIPVFLEVESNSEEKDKQGLKLLNLEGKDVGHIGLLKIYRKYGIKLHDYKEIKF